MEYQEPALHRTIMVVDVESFGDRRRTSQHQVAVRAGVYRALKKAFGRANISWGACHHEDRGDGVMVLAPAEVPKEHFVESLPWELVMALREHNSWHEAEEQIRLRMALHAGEIRFDDHGVTAASINLTFRLLDARPLKDALAESSGVLALVTSSWFFEEVVQQSVASSPADYRPVSVEVKETATTAWIRLPDHPHWASPGHLPTIYRSPKDRSWAVALQSRAAEPAPAAMTRTLPRDTATFTGRDGELAQIIESATAATETGQVVAIHAIDGMAGVGKTALAVHVAHRLADRFPDGQLFLRLHAHMPGHRAVDPADALASLLATAGVAEQHIPADIDARAAMWRDQLIGKKVLLILDDAEGHQQVEPLLPGAAGCLVFVTSRRRLTALDTAITLPLDTLPPDQAAALFTRLSAREVTGAQAEAVAQVVQLCGYLPLAISLLAGRLRHHRSWSVADLAADLTVARDWLAEIQAEDVAVAAAFDLSYRHLPPDRQRLFRYLGMHPGTELDVYGTAALAKVSISDARTHLDALFNDHLLDEPVRGRYRMHDLVRDYTRMLGHRDPAADRDQAIGRLFDYYQHTAAAADRHFTAETPPGTEPKHKRRVLAPELPTMSHAWAWMHTERANLVACAEHAIRHNQHQQVIRLAAVMAAFLRAAGPWDQAIVLHRAAASAAQHCGDRLSSADAFNCLGIVWRLTGNYPGAINAQTQALEIYRDLDHRVGQVSALNQLGIVRRLTDEYPAATDAHERALNIAHDLGDRPGEAFALNHLGIVRLVTGNLLGAIDAHRQALDIYRDLDDRAGQAEALNELGVVLRATGDHAGAIAAHTQALEFYRDLRHGFGEAFALTGLGVVLTITGDLRGATEAHTQALVIYRRLGNRPGQADALNELGVVRRMSGDHRGATEAHTQALEIYDGLGHRLGQAEALNNTGTVILASGHPNEAKAQHLRALRFAREVRSPLEEARALEGAARCASDLGQLGVALADLRQAVAIYQRIGAIEATKTAALLADLEILSRDRDRDGENGAAARFPPLP